MPYGAKEVPAATARQPFTPPLTVHPLAVDPTFGGGQSGVGRTPRYPCAPGQNTWSHPRLAYVYNGHHHGRVYVAYLDNPNTPTIGTQLDTAFGPSLNNAVPAQNDTNVYIAYSDDDGKTWSSAFAIPKVNANTRTMPHIAVDQTTGNIAVAWFDAVNDPANILVQVFVTVIPFDYFD